MSRIVTIVVALGVIEALVLGYTVGFDVAALSILATLVVVGVLSIVIARKSETGAVQPATCVSCGGLISPNAPYCKHCGEPVPRISG